MPGAPSKRSAPAAAQESTAEDPDTWKRPQDPAGAAVSRRGFLAGAAMATGVLLGCARRRDPRDRPNLIVVVADDLGVDGIGCYGGAFETPRIDAMAAAGLRFRTCYATPLCTPSRVELLTGRYPFRTGWTDNLQARIAAADPRVPPVLQESERTFAHVLRDAGYATAVIGKWHLCLFEDHPDHAVRMGFDEHCCWLGDVEQEGGDAKATSRYWLPSFLVNGEIQRERPGVYGPDVFSDYLLDFVARHRDRPFLAFYPLVMPHAPFQLTARELNPDAVDEEPPTDTMNFRRQVSYMDGLVGKVCDHLAALGIERNTLVLFLSDNGTPEDIRVRYHGVYRAGGKGTFTEAGMRVPLIAWWPGVVPGGGSPHDLVDLSDLLPTLADLAGASLPGDRAIDGKSLAAVLTSGARGSRRWVFSQLREARCVRNLRYKLYSDGRLYNVVVDPREENDLNGTAAAEGQQEQLAAILDTLRA